MPRGPLVPARGPGERRRGLRPLSPGTCRSRRSGSRASAGSGPARVLVVGAGGLGSPALLYLAAAGIGSSASSTTTSSMLSNLQRQVVHGGRRRRPAKVDSAADAVARARPAGPRSSGTPNASRPPTPSTSSRPTTSSSTAPTTSTPATSSPTPAPWPGPPARVGVGASASTGRPACGGPRRRPLLPLCLPEPPPAGSVASCAVGRRARSRLRRAARASRRPRSSSSSSASASRSSGGSWSTTRSPSGLEPVPVVEATRTARCCCKRSDDHRPSVARTERGRMLGAALYLAPAAASAWLGSARRRSSSTSARAPSGRSWRSTARCTCRSASSPQFAPEAGRSVLVHCASGARSARAVADLRARGVNAHDLAGGILAWVDSGLPVAAGGS